MGAREEIQKRIDRKRAEQATLESQITALHVQAKEIASYIQALEDTLKILPREGGADSGAQAHTLRRGSLVARVQEVLAKTGRPMHITDLMIALGKPTDDPSVRSGLSGSISAYVREGKIFSRPAPNTFGLIGMENTQKAKETRPPPSEPPPNFGIDDGEDIQDAGAEEELDVPF